MVIVKSSLKDTPEGEQTLCFCDTHPQHSQRKITSLSYLTAVLCSLLKKQVYEILQQQRADCMKMS